ncbi:FAD-dependent oxidoreductase [Pyrofollis japonicus]|uniref:NAD(P)/FAD-dependent oxidoreductase n=1 Tax=Pyrofollis japonicus TaxID=3060460 RepID=UPI00295AC01B|nr:FAD-dependent oxidoreductase [Pyrofollis japonicus]BEP17342.1 FAD-dependent oxidoreductase [Pyrofollis japonicus]
MADEVEKHEAIIIGAGMAGLTAALYLARQGVDVLVISADLGGQLMQATVIENYPGIEAVKGVDLAQRVEKQARTFGAKFRYGEVITKIDRLEDGTFLLESNRGKRYQAETVILAIGKLPKRMGIPGEDEYDGRGISYCTICDGPLYAGKRTVVVGVGDQGLEAVALLAGLAKKVYYVTPTRLFGDPDLVARVKAAPVVEILENHEPVRVEGDGMRVTTLVVRDKKTGEEKRLEVDGVFVELGYVAKTDFVKHLVDLNENGEIMVDCTTQATKTPGLFAAGDVTQIPFKQAVISAGDGAKAALSAFNYLQKRRGKNVEIRGDWRKTGKVKPKTSMRLGLPKRKSK